MQFSELKIWERLPKSVKKFSLLPASRPKPFLDQEDITELFDALQEFDEAENPPLSADKMMMFISQCDAFINRQTLANDPQSKAVIASLFCTKMQIYKRCLTNPQTPQATQEIIQGKIRHEYNSFIRAVSGLSIMAYTLNEEEQKNLTSPLIEQARELTDFLETPIKIKDEIAQGEISVPDILAANSILNSKKPLSANVRNAFHDLWEVESLRPLLTFAAYATQGYHYGYDGQVTSGDPLRLVFIDDVLTGYLGEMSGMCAGNNMVLLSVAGKTSKGTEFIYEGLSAILAHELHHYFEESFYKSNQLTPYPKNDLLVRKVAKSSTKVVPLTESEASEDARKRESAEREDELDKMVKEALSVSHENQIVADNVSFDKLSSQTRLQPFSTFNAGIKSYPNLQKFKRIRDAEIVVRVSESLPNIFLANGRNEEKAFQTLRDNGLNRCVDWFVKEKSQMADACKKMQTFSGIKFSSQPVKRDRIANYVVYEPTPLHDAVRNNDLEAVKEMMTTNPESWEVKDSLGQNAFELAVSTNNIHLINEFTKSLAVLGKFKNNIGLFNKVLVNLVRLAKDETSEFSKDAFGIFLETKKALIKASSDNDFHFLFPRIFHETFDQKLLDKIKELKTPQKILAAIDNNEIAFLDKFQNHFERYIFKADLKDVRDIFSEIDKKYNLDPPVAQKYFLPNVDSYRLNSCLAYNRPEDFLKHLKELPKIQPSINLIKDETLTLLPERVALACRDKQEKPEQWFGVFKEMVKIFRVNPSNSYGEEDQTLLSLLPKRFRKEALETYEKTIKDYEAAVAEKSIKLVEEVIKTSETKALSKLEIPNSVTELSPNNTQKVAPLLINNNPQLSTH